MNEEERADYYEQHKDDPQMWSEVEDAFHVPTNARAQGGLTTTVTVRFSPEDASRLRLLAERLGLSYSDVVREAVRRVVQPRFKIDLTERNIEFTAQYEETANQGARVESPFNALPTRTASAHQPAAV